MSLGLGAFLCFQWFSDITAESSTASFNQLLSSPTSLIFWHTLFLFVTVFIVARGILDELEKWINTLISVLLLLSSFCLYATQTGAFLQGFGSLFQPDFSKVPEVMLEALGQAFFATQLGNGSCMAYGAYMPTDQNIGKTAISVAALDTGVALLAGIAIFQSCLQRIGSLRRSRLSFVTLPLAFSSMPLGIFFGTLFFILLSIAALSSSISLIEPGVAWLIESLKLKIHRNSSFRFCSMVFRAFSALF